MIGKYPLNSRTVRGKLVAANEEAVHDAEAIRALCRVFSKNDMRRMIYIYSRWDGNCLSFDSTTGVGATREKGIEFINSLTEVLQSEAAAKFQFSGVFFVIIQTVVEPVVFRVTINNQEVTFQEAEYIWKEITV